MKAVFCRRALGVRTLKAGRSCEWCSSSCFLWLPLGRRCCRCELAVKSIAGVRYLCCRVVNLVYARGEGRWSGYCLESRRHPAPRGNMLGFTRSFHGRAVFRRCLEDYCREHEVGNQTQASLHECQQLYRNFEEWDWLEWHDILNTRPVDTSHKYAIYKNTLRDKHETARGWAMEHFSRLIEFAVIVRLAPLPPSFLTDKGYIRKSGGRGASRTINRGTYAMGFFTRSAKPVYQLHNHQILSPK